MNDKIKLVKFDWAMKRLLRDKANFAILEGFLSELLGQNLKILNTLESESNKNHSSDKQNRVDILVQSANNEIVLIEIQINSEYDYFYRMLYGVSKVVTEYMQEGEAYAKIKKVYSVHILYFDLGHGEDYIYHGTTKFLGVNKQDELALSERQKELYNKEEIHQIYPEYYLIKVNQFNNHAKNTLDEWIYFLKNEAIEDNFHAKGLLEAKEKLDEMKLTPAERQSYRRYLDDLHYEASMVETAKADIFFANRDGRIEGERIGIEIGMEKGKLEEKRAMAKKLKEEKMPLGFIQKVTQLSSAEIEKI